MRFFAGWLQGRSLPCFFAGSGRRVLCKMLAGFNRFSGSEDSAADTFLKFDVFKVIDNEDV